MARVTLPSSSAPIAFIPLFPMTIKSWSASAAIARSGVSVMASVTAVDMFAPAFFRIPAVASNDGGRYFLAELIWPKGSAPKGERVALPAPVM